MKTRVLVILFCIILFGFGLRVYQLDQESIWFDEGYTIHAALQPNAKEVMLEVSAHEAKPPTNYLMLHVWTGWVGASVFSMRFLYVLFGTAVIPLVFFFMILFFDSKKALLASLISAVSPLLILYSQEIRVYSVFIFFTLLAYYFFARMLMDKNRVYVWAYIITTIICNSLAYFSLINIGIQNLIMLYCWYDNKMALRRIVIIDLVLVLFFIPLVPFFFPQFMFIHSVLQGYMTNSLRFPDFISNLGILIFLGGIIGLFLLLLGFLMLFHKHRENLEDLSVNQYVFLFGTFIFFLFYISFVGKLISPFFLTRYTSFLFPFFHMAFAVLLLKSKRWIRHVCLGIFLFATLFFLVTYFSSVNKDQWDKVAYDVNSQFEGGDVILINGGIFTFDFYASDSGAVDLPRTTNPVEKKKAVSKYITGSTKRVWLIDYYDNKSPLYSYLDSIEGFQLVSSFEAYHIKYYLFKR